MTVDCASCPHEPMLAAGRCALETFLALNDRSQGALIVSSMES